MNEKHPASWRVVSIFTVLVLAIGNLAGLNYHAVQDLGGLVFILSPLLVTLIMRGLAGDGWSDVGFRPGLRDHPALYLAAIGIFPVLFAAALGLGTLLGGVELQPGWPDQLAVAVLAGAPAVLLFAFSEEFTWRGYLEPRLAALGLPPIRRHLLVAVIWWAWHVGYVLSQPGHSALPLPVYFALFFAAILPMSLLYGAWRSRTGSFWPAMLAHGTANMLAWPLLDPEIVRFDNPLVFATRPEGLVVLAGLWAAALYALRRPAPFTKVLRGKSLTSPPTAAHVKPE